VCRLVFVLAAAGCYSPHPQPGAPCGDGTCPAGLVCSPATQTCELEAIDAAVDDAPPDSPADATIDAPAPTAHLVQQNVGSSALVASQLSIVLPNLPAAGNTLVFIGACPQAQLDGVAGGGIATWTRGAYSTVHGNIEIWYGVSDGTSATVTASLATCLGPFWGAVTEWSGLLASPADDASATDGVTSPADPGPVTTTHASDLLILGVTDNAPNTFGTPAPGTWTALDNPNSSFIKQASWYQIVSTPGDYDPRVPETSHTWDAALIALKISP
jgi:hypothetical protein